MLVRTAKMAIPPWRSLLYSVSRCPCKLLPPRSASSATFISSADSSDEDESIVYKKHRSCSPPPSFPASKLPVDSCSLIGTVAGPIRRCACKSDNIGAYTFLEVRDALTPFRIMVMVWGDLAEVSLKFLKPNDAIYVSGSLSSYEKPSSSGDLRIKYQIIAKELNFVDLQGRNPSDQQDVGAGEQDSIEDKKEEERRERLWLWQIFFSSPHEWWDNRRNKRNTRCPDFKHKHTGEALWVSPRDPHWVARQLELFDQRRSNVDKPQARHVSRFL
ncbi:protein OSB1, mitochondrial-like [Wolffia australiana]